MLVASRGLRHHARTLDDGLDPGLAPLPRMFATVVAVEMHDVPSIVALAVQNLGPRNLIGRGPTGRDVVRASVEQAGLRRDTVRKGSELSVGPCWLDQDVRIRLVLFTVSGVHHIPDRRENEARAGRRELGPFNRRPLGICLLVAEFFNQTVLVKVECILYDEMRATTPAPQPRRVDLAKDLWFFSLCAGTIDFLFLQFLTGTAKDQLLRDEPSGGRLPTVPVILFRSGEEQKAFEDDLKRDPVTVEERHDHVFAHGDPTISEQDRKKIAFSSAVVERFGEWKTAKS